MEPIRKTESKMKRKIILLIMSVSLFSLAAFYSRAIIIFVSCFGFDKCYDVSENCLGDVCYAIVTESGLLVDSDVTTYFFSSDVLPIPLINTNYVYFEYDTSFCVVLGEGRIFTLSTSVDPKINNIESMVHVKNMNSVRLPCKEDMR